MKASCATTADCGGGLCGISVINEGCTSRSVLGCLDESSACRATACNDTVECVCEVAGDAWTCQPDKCFTGCG